MGFGDDPGIVVYDGSRCYLDLELLDGSIITIDVDPKTLDEVCRSSREYLSNEEDLSRRPPPTRFERINREP